MSAWFGQGQKTFLSVQVFCIFCASHHHRFTELPACPTNGSGSSLRAETSRFYRTSFLKGIVHAINNEVVTWFLTLMWTWCRRTSEYDTYNTNWMCLEQMCAQYITWKLLHFNIIALRTSFQGRLAQAPASLRKRNRPWPHWPCRPSIAA